MNKKQIYIGLGLLAVAVVGVIIYKKTRKPIMVVVKKEEEKSGFIINNGNRGRKDCIKNGGTVVFSSNGSECV